MLFRIVAPYGKTAQPGLDLPGGWGFPPGKTATPPGERLKKCRRGRFLTPTVNYGDQSCVQMTDILTSHCCSANCAYQQLWIKVNSASRPAIKMRQKWPWPTYKQHRPIGCSNCMSDIPTVCWASGHTPTQQLAGDALTLTHCRWWSEVGLPTISTTRVSVMGNWLNFLVKLN